MPPSAPQAHLTAPRDGPAVPAGFSRIGWHGISLALPEALNLRMFQGNARKGAVVFSDLEATRLEIRWRTPPRFMGLKRATPMSHLEKTMAQISRRSGKARSTVIPLAAGAVRIERAGQTLVLAADARRCYELHWPTPPEHVDRITTDFLATTQAQAEVSEWFWNIYGASGWVSAAARLSHVRLLPGESRLTFKNGNDSGTTILAAHSMADRLLGGRSLRAWAVASIAEVQRHCGGIWQESCGMASYEFHTEQRGIFRSQRLSCRIHLLHDSGANRIRWTCSIAHAGSPRPCPQGISKK